MKRWLVRIAVVLLLIAAALVVTGIVLNEPRPDGEGGLKADSLARKMQGALDHPPRGSARAH